MKNLLLFSILLSLLLNCKKDPPEKNAMENKKISISDIRTSKKETMINEVSILITDKNIKREMFKKLVLPKLYKLADIDDRHKILKIIGDKLSKETNEEVFYLGLENLKKELKKKQY